MRIDVRRRLSSLVLISSLGLAVMLSGCGQKGDLYLPPDDESIESTPNQAPY